MPERREKLTLRDIVELAEVAFVIFVFFAFIIAPKNALEGNSDGVGEFLIGVAALSFWALGIAAIAEAV